MSNTINLDSEDRSTSVDRLSRCVALAIAEAQEGQAPFHHLVLERIFPPNVYAAMLRSMPADCDYRGMSGRARSVTGGGGRPTRVKLDLLPEYIRHLPPAKRRIWEIVGRALCEERVTEALMQRLAPGLSRRFGAQFKRVGMYPIPILTRDKPGYRIPPHPDTHWKGMTVQLYLPGDDSISHVGTIFHERRSDGAFAGQKQMKFSPNSGYAFAVGDDTWHSADIVGPEVETRDSILLTYFVDTFPLRYVRNRAKRLGNLLIHDLQRITTRSVEP